MTQIPSGEWKHELQDATVEHAQKLGLTSKEFESLVSLLKRTPNIVECGVFSAMWSEHCSYKTSKQFLKKLPTTGIQVAVGPGENAGAVWLDHEYVAVFKMESHNHPSYIEPFQGAATGVGGILRDVFTMGARPIALCDSLYFGNPKQNPTPHLVKGVVSGIGFYGNCMGIPTVGGSTYFHDGYQDNILVNAMAVGIAKKAELFFGQAAGVGNILVMYGNTTGPDGVHGASMSSQSFSKGEEKPRPTVQVGDPFREKLVLEATLELMRTGAVVGIQDMGAAGLVSSSVEMAARAGTGVRLDLDKVPVRSVDRLVTPFERLLSESQERMLMVIKPENLKVVSQVLNKWDLVHAVVGEVTQTGSWQCDFYGVRVCDVKVEVLTAQVPPRTTRMTPPSPIPWTEHHTILNDVQKNGAVTLRDMVNEELKFWTEDFNFLSKRSLFEHYDHMVGLRTVLGPGHNAAVLALHADEGPRDITVSITSGVRSAWCAMDPFLGAAWNVLHHVQRHRAVGHRALAMTDCLNFGSPEIPEVLHGFDQCIEGLARASKAFNVPIVSGNVSFYNTTDGQSIPPTPGLGVVGKGARGKHVPSFITSADVSIYRLGLAQGPSLAASMWSERRGLRLRPPELFWDEEQELLELVEKLQLAEMLHACRVVGQGGLLGSLVQMFVNDSSMNKGVHAGFRAHDHYWTALENLPSIAALTLLFGELGGGFIVAVSQASRKSFEQFIKEQPEGLFLCEPIGSSVTEKSFQLGPISFGYTEWVKTYFKGIENGL